MTKDGRDIIHILELDEVWSTYGTTNLSSFWFSFHELFCFLLDHMQEESGVQRESKKRPVSVEELLRVYF